MFSFAAVPLLLQLHLFLCILLFTVSPPGFCTFVPKATFKCICYVNNVYPIHLHLYTFQYRYAIAGYLPTFFEDKFPSHTTAYSYINAYVVAFGGFMSSYLGGKITTSWIESGQCLHLSFFGGFAPSVLSARIPCLVAGQHSLVTSSPSMQTSVALHCSPKFLQ
jgi:hypothetical protein